MNGKYLYCIIIAMMSLMTYSSAQTNTSGSLSDYVIVFTAGLPGVDGNEYQTPSASQRTEWETVLLHMLQGNYGVANTAANNFGYRVVIFYDTTTLETYYILEKQSSSTNHWGMFVYNPTAKRSRLFIQAPHPKYDSYTDRQATYMFRYNSCRALFITGTHRCNSTTNTTCSGTSTVCGPSGPYKISDQAHTVDGMLQVSTNLLNNNITNLTVIQPHGFTMGEDDPHMIMSNGTRYTPSPDYIQILQQHLLEADDTLTFKTAHLDPDWDRLIALINTQGRLVNNSIDPCSNNATATTGRFIHIEQAYSLRSTTERRKKLSDAVGLTFAMESLTLISPNGGESINSGTTYDITWSLTGLTPTVQLEYSIDNGQSWVLISNNIANTGSYTWAVPNVGTWAAKIRIADADFPAVADTSASVFKIIHSVYPTTGSTIFVDASSAFGPRLLNGEYDFHRGMDFDGAYNTPIRPSGAGVIVRMEDSAETSGTSLQRFGNWILVRIDSANGQPRHNAYLHLNGFHRFGVGDTVTTMDTIGFMGKSGYDINTVHLHLELYKNLTGTTIDKDKAKNPIELLPYSNSNSYQVNFIAQGDSSAAEVISQDTELDFDGIVIYCTINDQTVEFNSRTGIDPTDNDNPLYNNVRIDPAAFTQESATRTIRFWVKSSESGTIQSVRISDVNGYTLTVTPASYGSRYAVISGDWSDAIWASTSNGAAGSATNPLNFNDVIINSGLTVSVNNETAKCNNISFSALTSKLNMESGNSVLSVYGDFTLFSTAHIPFSNWEDGGVLKFTGESDAQSIVNLGTNNTDMGMAFFKTIEIDKAKGKVIAGSGDSKLNISNSLVILNGTFELPSASDINGRSFNGSDYAYPTIIIQSGGTFDMIGGASQIVARSGSNMQKIGKVTVLGTMNVGTASTNKIRMNDIDVENEGTLRLMGTWSATSGKLFDPGTITIKNGGTLRYSTTNSIFWADNTPVILNEGGYVNVTTTGTITLPPVFTDNGGTFRYPNSSDELKNQNVLGRVYNNLQIEGAGEKTLQGNTTVNNRLIILGNAHLALGSSTLTYGSNAILQYGNQDQTISQTTTDTEFPASEGPENVTVYNIGNVTMHGSRTIFGNLVIMNGNVVTGENILTLGPNASLTEQPGKTVVGNIQTSRNILQGINNIFGGLGLEINAAGTPPGSTIVVRKTGTASSGNTSEGIKRYFQITPTETSGFNATLVFKYDESELNSIPESGLILFRSTNLSDWSQVTAVLDEANNKLTATGVTSFSYWTAGNSDAPLPIELSNFEAFVNANTVVLRWKTESEVNSYFFEIEKSGENNVWEKVGEVRASGNSNSPKEYSFLDQKINANKYRYRLKMIDSDGTSEYSIVIEVNIGTPDKFGLSQNYPNPFNPATIINYQIPEKSFVTLAIYDILGNEVKTVVNEEKEAGYYNAEFSATGKNLASGIYLCRITVSGLESGKVYSEVKKMQLLK
ncbi:MAG: peptidoglycan DD-metalloendopeptidase family protein [Ignavibacteriaceae bacterium]